jgi:hypothetical protein
MRSRLITSTVALIILSLAVMALGGMQPDAEVRSLLVGRWARDLKLDDGTAVKQTMAYGDDGEFRSEWATTLNGQPVVFSQRGTWAVVGGVIVETMGPFCLFPDPPAHLVAKRRVRSISREVLKTVGEQGKGIVLTRVED